MGEPATQQPAGFHRDKWAWLLRDHQADMEKAAESMRELGRRHAERLNRALFDAMADVPDRGDEC